MTKEEKELLLKDLLGRVLYGVKVDYRGTIFTLGYNLFLNSGDVAFENYPMLYSLENIESVKPYLRPLSSMTEEERAEYFLLKHRDNDRDDNIIFPDEASALIDWLNKKMFDYRGLIEKSLALMASEGIY